MKVSMKNNPSEYDISVPRSVTILLLFVLSMTAWNGIRAWATVSNWENLSRFRANPIYIFSTGSIWFILGAVLMILIFKGYRHTPILGLIVSILYLTWYWVDRTFIQIAPAPNIPFSIVVSIVTLIVFNTILFWPSAQAFFKETQ